MSTQKKMVILLLVILVAFTLVVLLGGRNGSTTTPGWVERLGGWFPSPLQPVAQADLEVDGGEFGPQGLVFNDELRIRIKAARPSDDNEVDYRRIVLTHVAGTGRARVDYEDDAAGDDADDAAAPVLGPAERSGKTRVEVVVSAEGGRLTLVPLDLDADEAVIPLTIQLD